MKPERRRLDKWLWLARFARSRPLAAQLVEGGFVRVNGARAVSPAKGLALGDVITVAAAHVTAAVRIVDLGERRGPASEARLLYDDLSAAAGGASDDRADRARPGQSLEAASRGFRARSAPRAAGLS